MKQHLYKLLFVIIFILSWNTLFAQKNYVVLSSGTDSKDGEKYIVTKSRLDSLPLINIMNKDSYLGIDKIIVIALKHIKERYPDDIFVFSSLTISRFAEDDYKDFFPNGYAKDWVIIVYFQYDKNLACQAIPILLDGTIVKGTNE